MKKFAKLLCLALACVLALSALAACGNGDKPTAKIIDIRLTDEDYAFGVDKTPARAARAGQRFHRGNYGKRHL